MIQIRGLLFKTLVLVIVVAIVSLAVSYGFMNAQKEDLLNEKIEEIKTSHYQTTELLIKQKMKDQILTAQEVLVLGGIRTESPEQAAKYLEQIWPRLQLSFSLSSMSIAGPNRRFEFGNFPRQEALDLQQSVISSITPQSAIICHSACELAASVPIDLGGENWTLTLLADLSPSIEFLHSVVGSNVSILVPQKNAVSEQPYVRRDIAEFINGLGNVDEFRGLEIDNTELKLAETAGYQRKHNKRDIYVWLTTFDSIGNQFQIIFVRDITRLIIDQNRQKQQIIIIFITVTLGILLTLITFSIIPISQVNKLTRAIKLIANKEYSTARLRLGQPRTAITGDELFELEKEFRSAINVLESNEKNLDILQKKLLKQATIDPITGLFTRNVLLDDLLQIRKKNTSLNVAIFFLDLDGFKPVNDNLGHEAGDMMLKKIGYRLKGLTNKFIKVYRIGGDEFVICYDNYSSESVLWKMAESIVQIFAAPFYVYETNIAISASIGIAVQDAKSIDSDALLRYADIAMYQAKEEGKNRFKFFDESMRARTQLKFTIKNDFLVSLAKNQLFLVYQPIVDSQTRKVAKLEALCRWEHPELGFIAPLTFIDVLEESENMNSLFEWIVIKVLKEATFLKTIGLSEMIISINLSPSQLVDDRALEILKEQMQIHQIAANKIELEITETTLITNFEQAKVWVEMAIKMGFRVAIDDFGAGYSSLSYLTAFNYNTVKLDRSLLDKIDVNVHQQRIVGSLTQMIHRLSVPVVAEGAETEEQFEQLRRLGCDYIQGYFISKPIPHDELVTFLQKQNGN